MYTFMSINGSSGSCHSRRDAELIPICNRLLTDLHVVRKMKFSIGGNFYFQNLMGFLRSIFLLDLIHYSAFSAA